MKSTIINIGDELLIGQTINTNASWIAHKLNSHGIEIEKIITISDNIEAIQKSLDDALESSKIVLITGGLGPTNDDLTKNALASYFNSNLVFHEESFNNIQQLLAQFDKIADEKYKVQAMMPDNARILINKTGTASGMWFTKDDRHVISMPGVPREVKYLMKYEVLPSLNQLFLPPTIIHKTLNTTGKGETELSVILKDYEEKLPSNFKIAYLPDTEKGIVKLRLSAIGNDAMVLETQLEHHIHKIFPLLGNNLFGIGKSQSLEAVIGLLLNEKGWSLGTAESCSGGNIAHVITSVPGSSKYYKGSIIAYSNEVKVHNLSVSSKTLDNHGAVSEQTVVEMARGTQQILNVNCSIAVSGVAGPTGGSPEKPVGTIWIAVAINDDMHTKKVKLGKDRIQNIERATTIALNMLRIGLL